MISTGKATEGQGRWRFCVVAAILALLGFALVARAVEIQFVERDFLEGQGQARHVR
ncbi:MAG: hypothetical protein U5L11_10030 [Arhodomonas sp.]|nr:hypothetical protein [Arhodomonas sp.]